MSKYLLLAVAVVLIGTGCNRIAEQPVATLTPIPEERTNGSSTLTARSTEATVPAPSPRPRDASAFEPVGGPGCEPPSPFLDWFDGDGAESGLVEVRATSSDIEVWGLLWETPPLRVDVEVKMVWRAGGSGDFGIRATDGGDEAELTWGPVVHDESNFDRPGREWGTAFVFPLAGCWDIQIMRGSGVAHVWVEAEEPS